jgi:hypothetical protein
MKIAVYSCSFGDYRNELKNGIDYIKFDKNIDYYFFTDNCDIKSNVWKILNYNLVPGDAIMDTYRWTSKYIKFVLPDILKKYDIVIWCDCKSIWSLNLSYDKIIKLFNDKISLINLRHPDRSTAQEELDITITYNIENTYNGINFFNEIKNINYETRLPDSSFIIRRTDYITNRLFEHAYNLLIIKGLKRDQNIYNHAIHEIKYPKDNILFLDNTTSLN